MCEINFKKIEIDWVAWRKAKQSINNLIANASDSDSKNLKSIQHFMDGVEDKFLEAGLDDETLFGPKCSNCGSYMIYDDTDDLYCAECGSDNYELNYYCHTCDISWSITSAGTHNDRCPQCNVEYEPETIKDLEKA